LKNSTISLIESDSHVMAHALRHCRGGCIALPPSDAEVVARYNELARSTSVGLNFYVEELARRRSERTNGTMAKLTYAIAGMTLVIAILIVVTTWTVLTK
jgi:hypothetical protein